MALKPYRRGVGIVLIDTRGRVFVGQRSDTKGAWHINQDYPWKVKIGDKVIAIGPSECSVKLHEQLIGAVDVEASPTV